MTTPLVDRFHFLAHGGQTKTPILAEAPEPKVADGTAVLRLYDPIDMDGGFWGVSAKEFAAVLDGLDDDVATIELHVNSPGGSVWDGLAMMNALRQHKARIVVVVDGIAASAASIVALAGDEVLMAPGSEMMVHKPMGLCVGVDDDMAKMAADLEHEARNMASLYAAKAGGTVEDWLAVMAAETWYSAEEAVAAGLADRVLDKPVDSKAKARFDLSIFAYAGRDKAPTPAVAAATPRSPAPPSASGSTTTATEADMSLSDALRERLGIADENADEDTILAALDEALDEHADPPENETIPDGHVVVPEARLRDLEAGQAESAKIAAKMRDQERESFLNSVRAKYAPANREAWAKEYDRDPEGTKAHFDSAPEIVALAPIGHAGAGETTADDATWNALFGETKVGA